VDARARRSQQKLRSTVIALATQGPITDVTATAICRAAGVTRDTFYRHADSPLDLLADALEAELDERLPRPTEQEAIGESTRALLEHVQQRAAAYRGAMSPLLAAPVRSHLEHTIRTGLNTWARLHPHIVPAIFAEDDDAMSLAIAFAAAGTVGAIEEWLRGDDTDIERAVEVILAASPEWWRR
jgi:AcrR family transcriptional regulator